MGMKARKLDLTDYDVTVKVPNEEGRFVDKTVPYRVKESVRIFLLSGQLQHNSVQLLKHSDLAMKVRDADGHILLDKDEYGMLVRAIETIRGLEANDVELIRRIMDAPKVNLKEVPKEPQEEDDRKELE